LIEVYDYPHPASRPKRILAVEALAPGTRIVLAMVWPRNRREHLVEVI
jgi:hypothetical protein